MACMVAQPGCDSREGRPHGWRDRVVVVLWRWSCVAVCMVVIAAVRGVWWHRWRRRRCTVDTVPLVAGPERHHHDTAVTPVELPAEPQPGMGHGPTIAMELCTRRPASVAGLPWPGGTVLHSKPNHGCPLFPNLRHSLRMLTQRVSNMWICCLSRRCDWRYAICTRTTRAGLRTCRMHTIVCVYIPTPHGRLATLRACHGQPLAALAVVAVPTCGQTVTGTCGSPTTPSMRSVWPGRLFWTCTLPRRIQMTACRRLR